MAQVFANNAYSATVGALTVGGGIITLAPGTGSRFPALSGGDHFMATLALISGGVETAWEIVKVTARAGDTLTVQRAQEGTTAQVWADGTPIDIRITAAMLNGLQGKAPLDSPTFTGTVSGITKAMVGLGNVDNTSDANKPISTATQTALDGKSSTAHTHAWSTVTGKPTTRDGYGINDVPKADGTGAGGTWAINITGNADNITPNPSNYKHLGAWGTGNQLAGSFLVNRANYADQCTGNTTYFGGVDHTGAILKRRGRIHSSDNTSLNTSISTSGEMGFSYGGSGEPPGPFISFGGLGSGGDYLCQLTGAFNGGGNDFKIRTRNGDYSTWNSWRTLITDGNYTSYSPSLTGGGASGTWGISISGNAATASTAAACTGTLDSPNTNLCIGRSGGVIRGYVYNDSSGFGFLTNDAGWAARVDYGTNNLYVFGNVTAYSDENVKTNWRSFGEGFVHQLAEVKSGVYDRTDCKLTQVGVSAQSLRKIMPHAVTEHREEGSDDVTLSVAYGNAAMAACVELAKAVVRLEARIAELEGKNAA